MFRAFLDWLVHGDRFERRNEQQPRDEGSNEPMSREQLLEARHRVEHQIAILEAGPAYIRTPDAEGGFSGQAADLRGVLNEINESLAAMGADGPSDGSTGHRR
jgi:hypothetical protein